MKHVNLEAELAALETLSLAQLREKWVTITGRPLPQIRAPLLRLALAWELQAAVHGGLSRRTLQTLDQLGAGRTMTSSPQAGMRLMREWNGRMHLVSIGDDGTIHWNDRQWKSLSQVAREITGTRWSGPAFFGLKQKAKAA